LNRQRCNFWDLFTHVMIPLLADRSMARTMAGRMGSSIVCARTFGMAAKHADEMAAATPPKEAGKHADGTAGFLRVTRLQAVWRPNQGT
jgi:hypothetical protein